MNQKSDAVIKFLAIFGAYGIYVLLNKVLKPMPPRPNATMVRTRLKRRMRAYGAPQLCEQHASTDMRPGQMAVIDNKNCEICNNLPRGAA